MRLFQFRRLRLTGGLIRLGVNPPFHLRPLRQQLPPHHRLSLLYYQRSRRHQQLHLRHWSRSFISGPPYAPMRDLSHNAGGTEEVSSNAVGSPSKYTRHGARHATKGWLSNVTRTGSRRASTRSTIGATASSRSRPTTTSPTRAHSRGNAISPTSPLDGENSRRDYTRNTSIRRNLLERVQRGSDRSPRGVIRDTSRRTTPTYLSQASAYSGPPTGAR